MTDEQPYVYLEHRGWMFVAHNVIVGPFTLRELAEQAMVEWDAAKGLRERMASWVEHD